MRDRSGPDAGRSGAALAPRARVTDLVITESAGEVLVYDQVTHHIHHLNRMSVVVWRLCDGRRTADDLVRLARMKLGGDVDRLAVRLALTKLDEARLLDGPLDRELRLSGTSRRSLVKRAAVASAIPAIVSISAPSAAMASSHCVNPGMSPVGTGCNQDAQCCSGVCGNKPAPWLSGFCT